MTGGREASTPDLVPIGAVVALLAGEFPDVSASKIRYLEAEGLVEPQRTARGSRRYAPSDIDTLRRVLRLQRDEFLPLAVIRERLGSTVDAPHDAPAVPVARLRPPKPRAMTVAEVAHRSGLTEGAVRELESFGLVTRLDASAVEVCQAVARLEAYGIEARHLRSFRAAADRETGLVRQALAPMLGTLGSAEAREEVARLLSVMLDLHVALLRQRSSTLDV